MLRLPMMYGLLALWENTVIFSKPLPFVSRDLGRPNWLSTVARFSTLPSPEGSQLLAGG